MVARGVRIPLGIVLTLSVASCATVSPDATSKRPASVKRDYHGLVEFDFGPRDFDSLLAETKLTQAELNVRATTLILLDRKAIPGAGRVKLIGVERRPPGTAFGWHCGNTELTAVVTAVAAYAAAEREAAETHSVRLKRIRDSLPNLSAAAWRTAATVYMIKRLERYETAGKPGMKGMGKGMAWRSWMRSTLTEINGQAKLNGLSDTRREAALFTWLMCHISPTELERLRDVLKDKPSQ